MFNACNYANGLFNSKSPKIYMFNKPTKLTFEEFQEKYPEAYSLLKYSKYKVQEGYLKRNDYKEVCKQMWNSFNKSERNKIKKLPNFDKKIFKEITGIEV